MISVYGYEPPPVIEPGSMYRRRVFFPYFPGRASGGGCRCVDVSVPQVWGLETIDQPL